MSKTLLEVDSSPLGERSISRHLTREFVQNWKAANPDGRVLTRDLNATTIAPIDAAWIGASYTPEEKLTAEQRDLLTLSNTLIDELKAADEYVIGVPMHNFSVPSVLKLWIDQVVRSNKTFSYAGFAVLGVPTSTIPPVKFIDAPGNDSKSNCCESFPLPVRKESAARSSVTCRRRRPCWWDFVDLAGAIPIRWRSTCSRRR